MPCTAFQASEHLGASRITEICDLHSTLTSFDIVLPWHFATCFFRIWIVIIVLDMSCKMSPSALKGLSAFQPFSPSRISVSGESIQPGVWSWVVELTHVAINLHKLNAPYSALQCLTVLTVLTVLMGWHAGSGLSKSIAIKCGNHHGP